MHNSESVLENETYKLLWDFEIQTDPLISARRLDQKKKKKKKKKENLRNSELGRPDRPHKKKKTKQKKKR